MTRKCKLQRFFDIVFSGISLLILFPLFFPIGILLKLTGEGEIFYKQERIGKGGSSFELYKFATMLKDSALIGSKTVTVKDDPRVLPIGKILRKTKINELPQLFNVFRGDMSLIGPRPLTKETFDAYSPDIKSSIRCLKPGLSGIGSIIFRNEENLLVDKTQSREFYRNNIAPYKGSLECWYLENYGLKLYFSAILLTIWYVIYPKSSLIWRIFPNIPTPPDSIKDKLL